jgi:uncharacterized membrane protein HdeD (DUF308 family)
MAMTSSFVENDIHRQLRGETSRLLWVGAALLIIGIAALFYPGASTLIATFFYGWILLLAGVASVFGSFSIRGTGPFFGALLMGLLLVAGGVFLLFRPISGALALTAIVGILFMIQGAAEAYFALAIRPAKSWSWVLISAIISVVLSLIILAGLPGTSAYAIGVLIGVNFITSGIAYLILGTSIRRELKA